MTASVPAEGTVVDGPPPDGPFAARSNLTGVTDVAPALDAGTTHTPAPGESRGGGTEEGAVETVLLIGGMTCGACCARIERRLNRLEGVHAQVNLATERARVTAPPGTTTQQLIDEVESIGFSARAPDRRHSADDPGADDTRRVRSIGRRLVVTALLFMPLCDTSIAFWLVPSLRFTGWQVLLLALAAPVVTWGAWPFYRAAVRNARHGTTTMDTLVSLGIISATTWSVYAMFWRDTGHTGESIFSVIAHRSGGAIYLDVAAGVTLFLLAGRYYEATTRRSTGNALRSLAAVGAKDAARLGPDGTEQRVPVDRLRVGDRFAVRPGETVATDGTVVGGQSTIDRSLVTGESVPVDVSVGDHVIGGTVSEGGYLEVEVSRIGQDTQLAHMVRLVEEAQNEKAGVQRLADRIAGVFVPCVLAAAVLTLIGWLLAGGSTEQAFGAALSVLIIACPCALGLATPAALHVASGVGARQGIFFKGYQALEVSCHIDTVLLDKTGTVTAGDMEVTDVETVSGIEADALLRWAGGLEQASEHLVARAVVRRATQHGGRLPAVDDFVALTGLGARGVVDGVSVSIGRPALFASGRAPLPTHLAETVARWERLGRTVVVVGRDDVAVGVIGLADSIRPSAAPAVRTLQDLGMHCVLVTGDNEPTARAVASSIGVDDVIAGALPGAKVDAVQRLRREGHSVAMVGDGVNDAPALAAADLGLAVGSGTDVAINAADLIIVRDDLVVVATAIQLAQRTIRTIRTNLAWAFAYNVAAIPLAACGLLDPLIAGAAMALSSCFVIWNSSRIRHFSAPTGGDLAAPRGNDHAAPLGRDRGSVVDDDRRGRPAHVRP
jgi:cation-transporting P-type ATPase A/B/Cu+-exporting ATPase